MGGIDPGSGPRWACGLVAIALAACSGGEAVDPDPPSAAPVTIAVDTSQERSAISPLVYGYNAASAAEAPPGATWLRLGGNRWTAYNWETNYSNAGSDWGPYSNDTYMGAPRDGPAHAVLPALDDARANGLGLCVTVPIQGWVSRDASGDVALTSLLGDHFVESRARKGAPFDLTPDASDAYVYEDEFANLVELRWAGAAQPIHLMLDNEPDLWSQTHVETQREPLTYAALLARSVEFASALKDVAPDALVFGPASYGWNGFVSLQDAPDADQHGDFLEYYLAQMGAAAQTSGRRLLDVLDLHWYSEAQGCGTRVTDGGSGDCLVAARVQAPRSLWDPTFVETSWITQWSTGGAAIRLIPRTLGKIAARYPGTRLSFSEYNHGGGGDVSGAVAQADTLGIFGREGVYAAAYWPLVGDETWSAGAWLAYRDFDAAGSSFGDTSVRATTDDVEHVSAYASVDAAGSSRVVLVLVHRPTLDAHGALDLTARTANVHVQHGTPLGTAHVWQLTSRSPVQGGAARPQRLPDVSLVGNALSIELPPLSVTTLELVP